MGSNQMKLVGQFQFAGHEKSRELGKTKSEPGAVATGQRLNFKHYGVNSDHSEESWAFGRSLRLPVLVLSCQAREISHDLQIDTDRLPGAPTGSAFPLVRKVD